MLGSNCSTESEQELDALGLDMLLDDGGRNLGQHVRQNARGEVNHGQFPDALINALRALQADQARADDEHALVGFAAQHGVQVLGIIQRHEAGFVFDGIQPCHGRHERPRAGADAQLVIRDGRAVLQFYRFSRRVDPDRLAAEQRGHAVFLIKVSGAVLEHFVLSRLAEQHVGDQRAAVNVVRFLGNDRDRTVLIHCADALDRADCRGAVADDNIIHIAHLSSYTMALFGQPCTHIGWPNAFLAHSSHFWIAPSFEVDSAPYGQDRMQV